MTLTILLIFLMAIIVLTVVISVSSCYFFPVLNPFISGEGDQKPASEEQTREKQSSKSKRRGPAHNPAFDKKERRPYNRPK